MRVVKVVEWHPDRRAWRLGYLVFHKHVRCARMTSWVDGRNGVGANADPDDWDGWAYALRSVGVQAVESMP